MTRPIYRTKSIETIVEQFSKDCPHAQAMRPIALQLRNSVDAMGTLFERPNPTDTVAAQQKRVALASKKLDNQVRQANEKLSYIVGEAHTKVNARIDAKLNLKENQFASEIRATFRSMSHDERVNMLKELAHGNRGPELAAIVNAPAIVSGVSEKVQQDYKTFMMNRYAPEEMAEHQAIAKAFNTASAVLKVAKTTSDDFANPDRLAEIEAREKEAREAEAAFNATANQPLA